MPNRSLIRVYGLLVAAVVLAASPARAQFTSRLLNEAATGEKYHIEAAAGFWSPTTDMSISSESLGIIGSKIDFKQDLGLIDHGFGELHLVLRPATKHKLRFQYIPIKYLDQTGDLRRDIVFNGQLYRLGVRVNSTLDWKAYRFGYEYDFVSKNRGFGGFLLDFKYTDVTATIATSGIEEFARARAPIPAIGGIVRVYVVPNISITGELSGITIPDRISEDYKAHYADLDIYGTLNFTNNVGAQFGYRSFDVGYLVKKDSGSFKLKGLYFGVVARY